MSVVLTKKYVMLDSEEVIWTTEYLMLYTICRINQCHYNWVQPYFLFQCTANLAFDGEPISSMDEESEVPHSGQNLGYRQYNTV